MENQECVEAFEKFTWIIENFFRMKAKEIYSEPFVLGGYPWYPLGNNVDDLSIYLEAMHTANMSKGWSRDVKFKLLVLNQIDTNMTIIEECKKVFNANENHRGYLSFMPLVELQDPQNGFIVKDVCNIGADVFVCKPTNENRVTQPKRRREFNDSAFATLGKLLYFLKTRKVIDMNEEACKDLQVLWNEIEKYRFDLTWLEPNVQSA